MSHLMLVGDVDTKALTTRPDVGLDADLQYETDACLLVMRNPAHPVLQGACYYPLTR